MKWTHTVIKPSELDAYLTAEVTAGGFVHTLQWLPVTAESPEPFVFVAIYYRDEAKPKAKKA